MNWSDRDYTIETAVYNPATGKDVAGQNEILRKHMPKANHDGLKYLV